MTTKNNIPIHKLSDGEIAVAETIAIRRKEANGRPVVKGSKEMYKEVLGVVGELLAAKVLNVCPDLTTHKRSVKYNTDEGDLIYKNRVIDIKTTDVVNGRLFVDVSKENKVVDYYGLVIFEDIPYGRLMGFISRKNLCIKKNINHKLEYGPAYTIPTRDLISFNNIR